MCEVNMQDIILLKQGEIVLKGLNKKYFEQKLISNVIAVCARSASLT